MPADIHDSFPAAYNNGFLKSTLHDYLLSARLISGRFPLGTLLRLVIQRTDLL